MRREFLMLAKTYKPEKNNIAGWYVSEKLDGTRCFWDGGISRDVPTHLVPYANIIDPKTGQRKKKIKPLATGLWSRYGNPIIAPDWFLNQLPCCPLDGELWAGRNSFQKCGSTVAKDEPVDSEWKGIEYAVFGSPSYTSVFSDGEIKNSNFHLKVDYSEVSQFISTMMNRIPDLVFMDSRSTFYGELAFLRSMTQQDTCVYLTQQNCLSNNKDEAIKEVNRILNKVLDAGGEGLVFRDVNQHWVPKRVSGLLKFKPFQDDEGTIVGYTSGRKTDKGSKLLGKIGALILDYKGKRLELSGFTDIEREFNSESERKYAESNPGEDMPKCTEGKHFKIGDTVTFKYRELTDDGLPKEARYWRKR